MIHMPPRHGKSFIVSERFPVWHICQHPNHQILLTSYGQVLSDKFSKRARGLATSDYVKDIFPDFQLDPNKQAVQEWETKAGGAYRSVGIGGGATGTGCDILIIDDPIKNAIDANSKIKRDNDWEWYGTTAYTRLLPGGGILIIMTRWHDDDLTGRLIRAMNDGDGDEWEILSFPAIAEHDEEHRREGDALHPDRYNIDRLNKIKRAIGQKSWHSLYQQRPVTAEGAIFKRQWWKKFKQLPTRFERVVQSWDCNFKGGITGDYVVNFVIGKIGTDYYILDRERGQYDFIQTIEAVNKVTEKWPHARPILIEDAANGPAVISSLKSRIGGIVPITPIGSKEARAIVITPVVEGGRVFLPADAEWVNEFIDETAVFPKGTHDDQVDAFTQGINHLEEEGKFSVFSNISALFGFPDEYPTENWHTSLEGEREVFIGAKWGTGAPHSHMFYGIGVTGATVGYHVADTNNHGEALEHLKSFIRLLPKNSHTTVYYDALGFGETMVRLIEADTTMDWRPVPVKLSMVEIDSMVAFLKMAMVDKRIKLRPWAILFDQMASFRCHETEKGHYVYGPPDGLSSNAVFALMLAHEAWKKYNGEIGVAVINDIEKTLTKIYYGNGDLSEFE